MAFALALLYALFILACVAASLALGLAVIGRALFAFALVTGGFAFACFHRVSSGRFRRPLRPSAPTAGGPFFMPEEGCTKLYQKLGQGGTHHE
jgi:hypothetical protein